MKFGAKSVRRSLRRCGVLVVLLAVGCNQQSVPVTGPDTPFGSNTGQGTPGVIVTGGLIDLGLTCLGFPSNAILSETPLTGFDLIADPLIAAAPEFMFFASEQNTSGTPGEITSFSIFVQESDGTGAAILEFSVGENTDNVLTFGQYRLTAPTDPTGPSMTLTSVGAGGVCRSGVGDEFFIEDLDIERSAGTAGSIKRLRISFLLACGQGCMTFIDVE